MKASGRRSVLLDANVLLLQVVGTCDRALISRFGRTKSVFDDDDFELLQIWLSSADSLVATPAVLAEVSNLCRGVGETHRRRARTALAAIIEHCDEQHVPSRECAAHPVYERLGLTDAGIAVIATTGTRVLTVDLDLYVALAQRSVDVVNFHHLR